MRILAIIILAFADSTIAAQDVNEKNEAAMKEAVAKVSPMVVKIETTGGREMAGGGVRPRPGVPSPGGGGVRKGVGPTTGLIVDADGYVLTSAFNFANNPSDVFVTVPGKSRLVAKVVATDTTRMLTLLKVDVKGLPVPVAVPKKEMQIGQWTLAVGRTFDPDITDTPSASAGIISAIGRMHGKVIQCDSKVSPVNYGGPLVALDGRVFGILVPASPRGEGETAGVEWYDSGIGFAVPLEDVFAVLPRLKEGKDLRRGILGITPKTQNTYLDEPIVGTISPDSAAQKAGIKPGDKIVSIDGRPIVNFFQVQVALGPKYENDKLDIVVQRDDKDVSFTGLVLTGTVTSFNPGFLGLLPMRDDPESGVEVRHVYVGSPAEDAGIKTGDRIMKASVTQSEGTPAAPIPVLRDRAQLLTLINSLPTGTELNLEVKRKDGGKTEKLKVKLGKVPELLPPILPLPSTLEKAGTAIEEKKGELAEVEKIEKKDGEKKEIETGLLKRTNAVQNREYWLYIPKNYKPTISYGVILWLHNLGKGGRDADDFVKIWGPFCELHNFIILGPKSATSEGWAASETEAIIGSLKEVMNAYTVDRSRIVTHGEGNGGQMAAYLGFNARELIRGVAMSGAILGTAPKDNLPGQRLSFFIIAGDKHPDFKVIAAAPKALAEKKFPTIWRAMKDTGKEYMDQKIFEELGVWLDSLDRI